MIKLPAKLLVLRRESGPKRRSKLTRGAPCNHSNNAQLDVMNISDFQPSLLGLLACGLIGAIAFRRHFAKHDKLKPRMVPWMLIFLACIATGMMIVVHIVNLLGFETGR